MRARTEEVDSVAYADGWDINPKGSVPVRVVDVVLRGQRIAAVMTREPRTGDLVRLLG